MALDLTSLHGALSALERAISVLRLAETDPAAGSPQLEIIRSGVIQHFEFTYELCWKFMNRYLTDELGHGHVEMVPRRELFRLAAEHGLIANVVAWFDYHAARNRTVHTYNQVVAAEVLGVALRFLADAQYFGEALTRRNADA